MTPTFEQAVEMARNLPPADFEKFIEWAKHQQPQNGKQNEAKRKKVEEDVRKFRLAMKWINEHRQEYLGQWVCLDGDKLISHGTDAMKVHAEAKAAGIKSPFMEQIVQEEKTGSYIIGGFEACR